MALNWWHLCNDCGTRHNVKVCSVRNSLVLTIHAKGSRQMRQATVILRRTKRDNRTDIIRTVIIGRFAFKIFICVQRIRQVLNMHR